MGGRASEDAAKTHKAKSSQDRAALLGNHKGDERTFGRVANILSVSLVEKEADCGPSMRTNISHSTIPICASILGARAIIRQLHFPHTQPEKGDREIANFVGMTEVFKGEMRKREEPQQSTRYFRFQGGATLTMGGGTVHRRVELSSNLSAHYDGIILISIIDEEASPWMPKTASIPSPQPQPRTK
ncbi:hypothetical protein BC826DRAFT_971398 [Russula brevipes]|nr:hypothetical protein BC826DRAFT_971398 [Russula brevipes]